MRNRGWSNRVVRRYILIQIPGILLLILILFLLRRWVRIPMWSVWAILALWIVKDVALFPFVWRSYDRYDPADKNPMVGSRGTAEETLAPGGYVRVEGERWRAEIMEGIPPIAKGEDVVVQSVRGMILIVAPAGDSEG